MDIADLLDLPDATQDDLRTLTPAAVSVTTPPLVGMAEGPNEAARVTLPGGNIQYTMHRRGTPSAADDGIDGDCLGRATELLQGLANSESRFRPPKTHGSS